MWLSPERHLEAPPRFGAIGKHFAMQAFGLQPLYGRDAAQMAPMLLSNFADVATALQQAASELASGNMAILQSLTGDLKLQTRLP